MALREPSAWRWGAKVPLAMKLALEDARAAIFYNSRGGGHAWRGDF